MVDLKKVKEHLKIDYDDSDEELNNLIEISGIYIDEMVGTRYKSNEKLVKLSEIVQLNLIQNMYDNKDTEPKTNKITNSILNRLALEGSFKNE